MNEGTVAVRVWDGPLRLWHWLFVACIAGSLWTGLSGDIGLVQWHMRFGYVALGLLLFRLGWLFWGGLNARWFSFRLGPARIAAFLRRAPVEGPRTVPGALLVVCMLLAVAVQAIAGLFTSDFIFTEGPLVRYASSDTVDAASALHHRVFWVVIGLIALHLTAHVVYGLRRDPTPLSMFTGRKRVVAAATPHFWMRGFATAAGAVAIGWYLLATF
jgi:cytochrome b